jgi:hypothetical protein
MADQTIEIKLILRDEILDENKRAIDTALADVKQSIDSLRQEISKRAAVDAGTVLELPNPQVRHGTTS